MGVGWGVGFTAKGVRVINHLRDLGFVIIFFSGLWFKLTEPWNPWTPRTLKSWNPIPLVGNDVP